MIWDACAYIETPVTAHGAPRVACLVGHGSCGICNSRKAETNEGPSYHGGHVRV